MKANIHFGIKEPAGDRLEYYTRERGAAHSSVWLRTEIVENIITEYECMHRFQLCEDEFASYAKETLFKQDPRSIVVGGQKGLSSLFRKRIAALFGTLRPWLIENPSI